VIELSCFFADTECIANSPKIEWIERPEPVAVSLLMEGEDIAFWQKLSKNTKSTADNKAYKTSGYHNELGLEQSFGFYVFTARQLLKELMIIKKKSRKPKSGCKQIQIFSESKDINAKIILGSKSPHISYPVVKFQMFMSLKFWHVYGETLTHALFF